MKNAKRNVIVSAILTIALCFSLMIGGTYAWFTDSAKVSVNTIVSGSLKVGLNMWDEENEKWVDADGKTLSFIRTDAEDEDNGLWAPGYKFRLPKLQVVNKGNLRLKFKLTFNAGTSKLLEVLAFSVAVDGGNPVDVDVNSAILEDEELAKGAMKEVELFGEFLDAAGNLYQNLQVSNLSVTLVATQVNATDYPMYIKGNKGYSYGTHVIDREFAPNGIIANGAYGAIQASKTAKITIDTDITAMESKDAGSGKYFAMAVWASGSEPVKIKGGNFTQQITGTEKQYDLIYASNGAKIEIYGGTFKCKTPKWTLNCEDGSGSTITVYGGSFYGFDPSNAKTGDGEIIVAEGYKVVKDGQWYEVVVDEENYAMITVENAEGVKEQVLAKKVNNDNFVESLKEGAVVILTENVTLPSGFTFNQKNVVIDGAGKYCLKTADGNYVIYGENITIQNVIFG